MVRVDITCDLMDEDETGRVWAFLRDARDQALIQPGAIVVADDDDDDDDDDDAPAVAISVWPLADPLLDWEVLT